MADPKEREAERKNELPAELSPEWLKQKQVSPLNDAVWRFLLIVAAGCILAWAVPALLGLKGIFGHWMAALLTLVSWVFAIRLLLLESRAKKFWIIWLAVGVIPLLAITDTSGGWIASIFSFFFLLFRRYRPYRHLTAQRQRWLFFIGIVVFILLTIAWPSFDTALKANAALDKAQATAPPAGWMAIQMHALLDYGLSSLCYFWFFSLFNLFFGIRLNFMRLKPKLAVSALLIAFIPILLVLFLAMAALYGLLGESRALRASAILKDWATAAVRDPNFFSDFSMTSLTYQKTGDQAETIARQGEKPAWWGELTAALQQEKLSLAGISVEGTGHYFWAKGEVWLLDLSRYYDSPASLRGCRVDRVMLDRLAKILNCDVEIYQTSPIDLFPSRGKEPVKVSLDEKQIGEAIKGKLEAEREKEQAAKTSSPSSRPSLWKKTLYFGMSDLEVIALEAGKLSRRNLLLATKGSLSRIFGELLSQENPLTRVVFGALMAIAFFLLILEAAALLFTFRITGGITKAVNALHRGTRRIAEGDLDTEIEIPNQDEFGDLAFSFNQMAKAVKKGREEAVARGVLERELETARQIQQKLLPHAMPQVPGFEICGTSLPSRKVGGDYFDFIETQTGELGVAIGDVSGKGMPAALLMANVQASLHAQVIETGAVSEMVSRMNNLLVQSTDSNMFVTFFCGYLNRSKSSLTWTNAGHNPPLLVRSNAQVERLESAGLMLGFLPDQAYPQEETPIQPGDVLILFTDGITEASAPIEGEKREHFGDQRLIDTVLASRTESAPEIQAAILKAVSLFTADAAQEDDITLVVVKRAAPQSGG